MGRPRTSFRKLSKTSQEGTLEGETRATFIVKEKSLEIIKGLAGLEKKRIKEIVNEAFDVFFSSKSKELLNEAFEFFDREEEENGS